MKKQQLIMKRCTDNLRLFFIILLRLFVYQVMHLNSMLNIVSVWLKHKEATSKKHELNKKKRSSNQYHTKGNIKDSVTTCFQVALSFPTQPTAVHSNSIHSYSDHVLKHPRATGNPILTLSKLTPSLHMFEIQTIFLAHFSKLINF